MVLLAVFCLMIAHPGFGFKTGARELSGSPVDSGIEISSNGFRSFAYNQLAQDHTRMEPRAEDTTAIEATR